VTRGRGSVPDTRLVRPRLSDDQLATLRRYGTVEPTTVGQVLFAAGDLSYDLIVLLEGRVEVSVVREGKPWPIAAAGPRDFLAELNLLTGQRVYFTGVVTEAGSIVRVPRDRMGEVIDRHGDLGAFLLQEMFRRRQMFMWRRASPSYTALGN
jgi:thioredoxin reductase (NADPH)